MQNGKGDDNRTTNWKAFRDGIDRIREHERRRKRESARLEKVDQTNTLDDSADE